jgi:Flp pilus assembly protein TadB
MPDPITAAIIAGLASIIGTMAGIFMFQRAARRTKEDRVEKTAQDHALQMYHQELADRAQFRKDTLEELEKYRDLWRQCEERSDEQEIHINMQQKHLEDVLARLIILERLVRVLAPGSQIVKDAVAVGEPAQISSQGNDGNAT